MAIQMTSEAKKELRGFRQTFFVAIAAAVAVVAVSGCKYSPEEKANKVTSHVSRKLDLNDAQKAEFKKITEAAVADFKSLKEGHKAVATEVEKQIVAEKADTAALKKLLSAQNAKRDELMLKYVDQLAAFQATLTPDQKQKALKSIQKFREKMEDRFDD